MRWSVLALLFVGSLLRSTARPAHAEEPPDLSEPSHQRQEAKRLRDLGAAAIQRGDYSAALENFNRAYEQLPSTNLRFNIGVALDGLGHSAEAMRAFEEYLAEAPNPSEEARSFVRLRLSELATRVARLRVVTQPADAVVEVDGQRQSRAAIDALPIEAGEHIVVAAKPGYTSASQHVVAIAGELCQVELVLDPAPAPAPMASQAAVASERAPVVTLAQAHPAAPQQGRTPLARRWWVWTVAAGVAVIGAAVTVGVIVGARPVESVYHREVP